MKESPVYTQKAHLNKEAIFIFSQSWYIFVHDTNQHVTSCDYLNGNEKTYFCALLLQCVEASHGHPCPIHMILE